MKKVLLTFLCCLFAASAMAGDIVPWFDDGDALVDYTAAKDGANGDITSLNPGSTITHAARITPSELDVTEESGPVVIIETGGTLHGSGIYICNGEFVFALRTGGSYGARPLTDLDGSDGAVSVEMGEAIAGQENNVYASLNLETGMVLTSVNGNSEIRYIVNGVSSDNLTGNQTVAFLGDQSLSVHMGGLSSPDNPLLNTDNTWIFDGVPGAPVRGQIFGIDINPNLMANDPSPATSAVNIDSDIISEVSFDSAEDPANAGSQHPDVTGHFVTFYQGMNGDPNLGLPPLYETFVPADTDPITVPINTPETFELALGQEVFWRVEEQVSGAPEGDSANIAGPVWSFETLPPVPAAVSQPEDQAVFAGEQAVFEFTFTSKTAASASWYKEGDPDTELLDSDPDVTIQLAQNGDEYTSTLSIDNAEIADQGYYYCLASNAEGDTQSSSAAFGIKRMVGYWPLDGDYQDYSGEGHDIFPYVDPDPSQWVDGVVLSETGQALSTIDNRETTGETAPFNAAEYTDEITASLWLKWPGTDDYGELWRGIFCSNDDSANNWFLELDNRNGLLRVNAPGYDAYQFAQISPNEWVHIAFTSSADEVGTFYINGSQVAQTVPGRYSINDTSRPVILGCTFQNSLDNMIEAVMDDVRLYNYAMSPEDIAGIYYDVSGEQICVNPDAENLAYDINGDCEVGLEDLAAVSVDWLNNMLFTAAAE
ncbi:LamG-like jellyroll fold domain-containing protein [Sedimentisphaera salicampi]|uniref:Immunoglobulin I-set domain protein n=1 Tax=Sedimentisphaera salicampi TaxID=1941349 RepID=A0A1W6LPI4_9BACT|nr:LamG-like jellyroll fold domain-containing protein [Sedimentisphaera salicampi]ARN57642.1 Immunoglobulin I-set domain protein [Sedimentisphaera salicampi]OXU14210.1 Immunoglobulin I-set domain protein [Sedimentisphaera salicampi]